jgi:hypothetical protein
LTKYNLNVLDPAVRNEDPDGDGFTNYEEYVGLSRKAESDNPDGDADSTNPTDKNSHPPYYAILWVKEWRRVRFRVVFKSYNGEPNKPETLDFQINTLDRTGPTRFYKLTESIEGTKYRFDKFEHKTTRKPKHPGRDDVSELTLTNSETNESVILPLNAIVNSPDSIAILWHTYPPPQEIQVRSRSGVRRFVPISTSGTN